MSIIKRKFNESNRLTLFNGDCSELLKSIPSNSVDLIITSPPYCIGKAYEDPHDDIKTFKKQHEDIFDDLYRVLKTGGSICWQVGYHVSDQCVIPLDYVVYNIFTSRSANFENPLILRNRIIWTFGHGLNSTKRFSGRHEMILWFTKGEQSVFNLDDVRVPQKYPGKKSYKGPNKGNLSGNPLGKNPSDVWDIPNVKAMHVEKTDHPCQFPVAIPQRLIKALPILSQRKQQWLSNTDPNATSCIIFTFLKQNLKLQKTRKTDIAICFSGILRRFPILIGWPNASSIPLDMRYSVI